jgi:hypothetical protein
MIEASRADALCTVHGFCRNERERVFDSPRVKCNAVSYPGCSLIIFQPNLGFWLCYFVVAATIFMV